MIIPWIPLETLRITNNWLVSYTEYVCIYICTWCIESFWVFDVFYILKI